MNFYAVAAFGILLIGLILLHVALFRSNRLLFWTLLIANGVHVAVFGYFAYQRYLELMNPKSPEIRVKIAQAQPTPLPPKATPTPVPVATPKPAATPRPVATPKPVIALPKGRLDGDKKAKVIPKGKDLKRKKPGKPGPKKPLMAKVPNPRPDKKDPDPGRSHRPGKVLTKPGSSPDPFYNDPDAKLEDPLDGDRMSRNDFLPGAKKGSGSKVGTGESGGGGDEGDEAGDPEGTGKGAIPVGFENGTANGRVYFMRLKHGSGSAWNAFSNGTNRLLAFLGSGAFKTESEGRAMSTGELQTKYMRRNKQPTFLYIYCDDSFSLSDKDVNVLRAYMAKGGFLFLDSRPDPEIRRLVARELDKVLPGTSLTAISRSHPINDFLYKMDSNNLPVGMNIFDKKNYGVSQGGRLVAFYTPGNFGSFYEKNGPNADDFVKAQYQMGANVLVYAMKKGDGSGITKRRGASAKVTTQQLENLGFLDKPVKKKPGQAPTSVKVKATPKPGATVTPTPEAPEEPDEIKVLEED